jgi:hypothetical protein
VNTPTSAAPDTTTVQAIDGTAAGAAATTPLTLGQVASAVAGTVSLAAQAVGTVAAVNSLVKGATVPVTTTGAGGTGVATSAPVTTSTQSSNMLFMMAALGAGLYLISEA